MKIHLIDKGIHRKIYLFTKTKNHCLSIEYDPAFDFGNKSTSGATIDEVVIHFKNSFIIKKEYKEISIKDVPESIRRVLSFLS